LVAGIDRFNQTIPSFVISSVCHLHLGKDLLGFFSAQKIILLFSKEALFLKASPGRSCQLQAD
jgi:hypothetical protein